MAASPTRKRRFARAFVALALIATTISIAPSAVAAQEQGDGFVVRVQVFNLQEEGGFFFTSVWTGLHDGSFDLFDEGASPSPGLESLAEDGDPGLLQAEFGRDTQTQVGQTPVFPTAVISEEIIVSDPQDARFFSFASMMLPSNDAFFGNEDPLAYEVFDEQGNIADPIEIIVRAEDIYDAGTERNNAQGLPFLANVEDTTATETDLGIFELADGLAPYVGLETAVGEVVESELDSSDLVAVIFVAAVPLGGDCQGLPATVNVALGEMPTDGADVIVGTEGDDVINGLGGNDIICGLGGDDIINAGNGADTVHGGEGNDAINAGQGRDVVFGDGGDDFISGGKGKDTIRGGDGNDDLRGNNGTDSIGGGAGDDFINGGQKADVLSGDFGDDTIVGGTQPDMIRGGAGADTLNGGGNLTDTCDSDSADVSVISCELLLS